jgi:hypothetical protein
MSELHTRAPMEEAACTPDLSRRRDDDRPARTEAGRSAAWPIVGLALVGLGLLAWYSFGPDLRRYLKIRNM